MGVQTSSSFNGRIGGNGPSDGSSNLSEDTKYIAEWRSGRPRRAHNSKIKGSNPFSATKLSFMKKTGTYGTSVNNILDIIVPVNCINIVAAI